MIDLGHATWKRASLSKDGEHSPQVAVESEQVAIRDGENPTGPVLVFSREAFRAFVSGLRINKLK